MTFSAGRPWAFLRLALATLGLAACSSSFGGGGSSPSPTYIVVPGGGQVPAQTAP